MTTPDAGHEQADDHSEDSSGDQPGLVPEAGDRPRVDLDDTGDGTSAPVPEPASPDDPEPSGSPEDAEDREDQAPGQPGGPLAEDERPGGSSDGSPAEDSGEPLRHQRYGGPEQG